MPLRSRPLRASWLRPAATALCAGALTFASTSALADEPGPDTLPISVVAAQTGDAYDQAEALTKALRNAVRAARGWSLGEGDFALEVLTLSLKCSDPPDASCESRIADQVKADRYIWAVLNKQGNDVVGDIHLWVRGKGSTKVDVRYSGNLTEAADDSLKKIAGDAIEKLTGGPPKGGVSVRAGTVAGQVFVDNAPLGALSQGQGVFPLPAGPHRLVVKATGFADATAPVLVKPNSTTELVLNMVPMETEKPTNWRRIGGYAGLGAGVAFAAVGVYSSLQVNGIQNDDGFKAYAAGFTKDQDVCTEAAAGHDPKAYARSAGAAKSPSEVDDLCNKAGTFELMQAVFYGLGAVAGGTGVYLLATSGDAKPGAPQTGLVVAPKVTREGGGVAVKLTF